MTSTSDRAPPLPPLRTHAALERALREAGELLKLAPAPGSAADQRFRDLLQQISAFQGGDDALPSPVDDLRRRLQSAAEQGERAHPGTTHPWSSMVGGDVRPPNRDAGER